MKTHYLGHERSIIMLELLYVPEMRICFVAGPLQCALQVDSAQGEQD